MIVVGIVGGIASGKSSVAREFEQLGAVSINADQIGHEILEQPEVVKILTERWGKSVLADGKLNRAAIAKIVFAKDKNGSALSAPTELAFLESVSHPRISKEIRHRIEEHRQANETMVVLDAALLLKAGWKSICDIIIYVDADRETRVARAKSARGWTDQQYDQREQSQIPLSEKRANANILIDNSHGLDQTRVQVRDVWDRLTSDHPTQKN